MNDALKEHLLEMIRENWGMSMQEMERITGLPRRLLRKSLESMAAGNCIRKDGGRYVVS
jgi:DNA-binding IclR family transcriptional regulator